MQERTSLEDSLTGIGKVERELEDQIGMIELGEAENDQAVVGEAEAALKALKKEVARRELEALLSGEADRFNTTSGLPDFGTPFARLSALCRSPQAPTRSNLISKSPRS